ncbi:MAG TPA: ABC transporter permease, partial [Spirochaetia bacterium]|nr:ABC transporter permease [Spirochaetia bacterium]
MYKWFAAKRVAKGIFMYALLIFIMSALFNNVNEQTMRAQINEQVRMESQKLKGMQPTAIQRWQLDRKVQLEHTYKLDRPLGERIVFSAIDTLTFMRGSLVHDALY